MENIQIQDVVDQQLEEKLKENRENEIDIQNQEDPLQGLTIISTESVQQQSAVKPEYDIPTFDILKNVLSYDSIKTNNYVVEINEALNGDEGEEVKQMVLDYMKMRQYCLNFKNVYKLLGKQHLLADNTKLLDNTQIPQIGKDLEERNKRVTIENLKKQGESYKDFNQHILKLLDPSKYQEQLIFQQQQQVILAQQQEHQNVEIPQKLPQIINLNAGPHDRDSKQFKKQQQKIDSHVYFDQKYNIDFQINQRYGQEAGNIIKREIQSKRKEVVSKRRDCKYQEKKQQNKSLFLKYI
eukprot:403331048